MLAIALFELRTRLKLLSTYVYFVAFAAAAGLWMAAAGGVFTSANIVFGAEKVFINSPYALAQTIATLGLLGVIVVAAFMGRAVQQDFETQSFHFFFTSPITKAQYLAGRFVGAVLVLMLIFLGIAAGLWIGAHWPGVDATRVGPWSWAAMFKPYAVILLPNVLFLGAIFFTMGALGRRMLPVYIAGVAVLIGNLIAARLLRDIDNRTIAALVDPVGTSAQGLVVRYWSAAERNSQLVPLANELLWNRAMWLALGVAVFAFCAWRFRMAFATPELRGRKAKRAAARAAGEAAMQQRIRAVALPQVTPHRATGAWLAQLPGLVALYVRETVKNVYFLAIVVAGAAFVFANAKVVGSIFGTNTYPVTYQVIDFASGTFVLFMLIITTFYAGELAWRERDARMALIADSLPTPTWLGFAAKLATLFLVQALLQAVVMGCGMLIQLASGYTKLEPGQYLYRLFLLQLPDYWMLAALALTVHVLVNNKYLGHFLMVLYFIAEATASAFGWDLRLYRFASVPSITYSDMNGYGHFVPAVRWFQLYWGAVSVLLLVLARLFWVRGVDSGARARIAVARSRISAPVIATTALATVAAVATGGWIYYNTNVLNPYRTEFQQEALRADYEKRFKALGARAQPKVVASKLDVDIFPHEHRVRFRGAYTLRNKSAEAIPELYVLLPERARVARLETSLPSKLVEQEPAMGWRRFAFAQPVAPGATFTLDMDIAYAAEGFTNEGASRTVVDNGTFVNSSLLPAIGYQDRGELTEDRERKKHGLGPRPRMPDLDDPVARKRNYISSDGDWIDFEATVSTDEDQMALAPGYLQDTHVRDGRRYFHYKMDVPILDFYAFLSARYAVKKDAWRGRNGDRDVEIPIEIYYQPGHEYNLDAMIAGVKDSLDYDTKNFSPYQHRQVRILEFPRYASFAQSFPNTIPFSESIGFIAKVDAKDPKDLDYPYYVTAHEVAHQWWAHQVIGGYVQGATMMSETLAQYSALMVMKKKYGDDKMARFLKYELDQYLVGRGAERKQENPLYRNENQPYIHYRKGSVAMYALQDAIGEERVNRALAAYVKKVAYQEPPYTISRELLAEFRAVTPPEHLPLIEDLFETITLWENRAISATAKPLGGERYAVTVKVAAKKLRSDAAGQQTEVPMNDWIDIGVQDGEGKMLAMRKEWIKSGESTFTLEVSGRPAKAGIDPVAKLIDRRSDDNLVPVAIGPA